VDWREVSVKVDREAVDVVSEVLVECGAGGVSIEDPDLIKEQIALNIWDAYEFPEELLKRDYIQVNAYFPCDRFLDDRLKLLEEKLDYLNETDMSGKIKETSFAKVREEDWANSWKAYYKTIKPGKKIVIKPSWESYQQAEGELVIELDPGMAFGTGTHATTIMCLKALEHCVFGGEIVFDIGTGSGILSIAAAKLGAQKVSAVDIDEVAVTTAKSNVELNGVGHLAEVMKGNLLDCVTGTADIVVANIVADVIISVAPDAAKAVRTGGVFIASGIIAPRADEVIEKVTGYGFKIIETDRDGDWVCLTALREE
jgi:ribosomal protein L11 methyltransferase